jgi:hypothetical protein
LIVLFTFGQSLQAQICRSDITSTTPTKDFTIHDDGTVTHRKTGLMWMHCALGQSWNGAGCAGDVQAYTWQGALQAAYGLSFTDHSDWQLPNIKELNSIVEQACINPAINATVLPATPSNSFWSVSPYAGAVSGARNVNFYDGGNTEKNKLIQKERNLSFEDVVFSHLDWRYPGYAGTLESGMLSGPTDTCDRNGRVCLFGFLCRIGG